MTISCTSLESPLNRAAITTGGNHKAEHTDWMDVVASIEARSSISDIHLGFQAMAYAQNATNLSAESGCDSP